jgi:integrase
MSGVWRPELHLHRPLPRSGPTRAHASFDRKLDAERFLATQEASIGRGDWIDPDAGKVTIGTWATRWLDGVRPTLKPKTIRGYESLLDSRLVPVLGATPLAALRTSDVQAWIGTMEADGLSPSRIRQAHVLLGQVLEAAARDGRIGRNPARGVKLPRIVRREARYLEPDVVDAIADRIGGRYGLLVRIMGVLGPRFGETAALRRRSVDLLRRRLVVAESLAEIRGNLLFGPTKSHATRSLPVPGRILQELEELLKATSPSPDALLFTAPGGGPLRLSNFRARIWLPALDTASIAPIGLHALRHSAVARMIAAGASPKTVQSIMGHASAAFTLTVYGHLFDTDLDELAERLDVTASRPSRGHGGATVHRLDAAASEDRR